MAPRASASFTQDIFFSIIAQVPPTTNPPLEIDDAIVIKLISMGPTEFHKSGRLFVVDHSYQTDYPTIESRYTAAYITLFYIRLKTNDLLSLVIKTTIGGDLLYAPPDSENNRLLAKTTLNMNNFNRGRLPSRSCARRDRDHARGSFSYNSRTASHALS